VDECRYDSGIGQLRAVLVGMLRETDHRTSWP
jgi:hypothetical protein